MLESLETIACYGVITFTQFASHKNGIQCGPHNGLKKTLWYAYTVIYVDIASSVAIMPIRYLSVLSHG